MVPSAVVSVPDLSEFGLGRAMDLVLASPAGFPAFVITECGGERRLHEFTTERPGQSVATARYFLRTIERIDRAVLIWDGYVTSLGKRIDAVLAEYSEAGSEVSIVSARRYRPGNLLRRGAVPIGDTIAVGEGHPLF